MILYVYIIYCYLGDYMLQRGRWVRLWLLQWFFGNQGTSMLHRGFVHRESSYVPPNRHDWCVPKRKVTLRGSCFYVPFWGHAHITWKVQSKVIPHLPAWRQQITPNTCMIDSNFLSGKSQRTSGTRDLSNHQSTTFWLQQMLLFCVVFAGVPC